jgi:hypothetical protein
MDANALLTDGFERVHGAVHAALRGFTADVLHDRPAPGANSVAWLVWHLTRVQDDHVADAAGEDQVWHSEGWYETFGLPLPPEDTGFGHSPDEVAAVRVPSATPLRGYFDAVHRRTLRFIGGLQPDAYDEIVDEGWTPPVTLGVRLTSVLADDLQHAGQAAYVKGLLRS